MLDNYWLIIIITAFVAALLLTGLIIPQVLRIAFRWRLFDNPDVRKVHMGAVPRLGGTTFFPIVVCSISLILGLFINFEQFSPEINYSYNTEPILFLVCSMTMLYLVGLADDLVGVKYAVKFAVQAICAVMITLSGVCIHDLYGLFGIEQIPTWIGWLMTGFAVVYIVNSFNLIDGIDGLASGIAVITLAYFGTLFYLDGFYVDSMIAWTVCGTLLAFFYYNVFGNPDRKNKIFMGDTGSLTVGMIIAFLALELSTRPVPSMLDGASPLIVAFAPLIIPLFDVVRVFLHRIRLNRNPFLPDRNHIHHKLLALGLSTKQSLLIILLSLVILLVINVLLSQLQFNTLLLLFDILIWSVANVALTNAIRKRERRLGAKLYE